MKTSKPKTSSTRRAGATRHAAQAPLLRGSLIELRRRCGKPGCHCRHDEPHCTPALSYSQGGTTRIITLTSEQAPGVKAALKRYRQALERLERQAMEGIATLRRQTRRRNPDTRRNSP